MPAQATEAAWACSPALIVNADDDPCPIGHKRTSETPQRVRSCLRSPAMRT